MLQKRISSQTAQQERQVSRWVRRTVKSKTATMMGL
jgi:hypothetical protein